MDPTKKLRVVIICGARSTEHEVSLASSYNIANSVNRDKYDVFVVGIDKEGVWRQYDVGNFVENPKDFTRIKLGRPISGRLGITQCSNKFYDLENGGKAVIECDVIFPAVLGNYAEDGTLQGLLRMMDVPFTTPDVLGSAVGMDKEIMKRLLTQAGLKTAKFTLARKNMPRPSYSDLAAMLGEIMFVKPANNGSSVGVYRVTNEIEFNAAIEKAFRYDVKVLIEEAVKGREVEISMMGNIGNMKISDAVGEIVSKEDGFYSYDTKYVHSENADLIAPADVTDEQKKLLQEAALKVCEALECEGFARVDFFLKDNNEVYVSEINTMPGFTNISMYPRLWIESGVPYSELIDKLLGFAIERHNFRVKPIITSADEVLRIEAEG